MPVVSETNRISGDGDNNDLVRASTPASPSKRFPGHFHDTGDVDLISQVTAADGGAEGGGRGNGDFNTLDLGSTIPRAEVPRGQEEGDDCGAGKTASRQRNSSLQRVMASLSKTQSQIVELFSRANPSRSGSVRKLNKNQKRAQLDTIIASSSTSAGGEPQLLAANRKPGSPIKPPPPRRQQPKSSDNHLHVNHHPNPPQSQISRRNATEIDGTNATLAEAPNKLVEEENRKLRRENHQLWEDNRMLAGTLDEVQVKLEYLQERNKYLELAMHQEGKVLTDIIRECHEEIAKLKQTQCELLSDVEGGFGSNQQPEKTVDRKIREYYIGKYANSVRED